MTDKTRVQILNDVIDALVLELEHTSDVPESAKLVNEIDTLIESVSTIVENEIELSNEDYNTTLKQLETINSEIKKVIEKKDKILNILNNIATGVDIVAQIAAKFI